MMKKTQGSVLAIVLISISIMLLMIYVLAQLTTSQQKSSANYMDMKLAENYARIALLHAESQTYAFDLQQNYLESMPTTLTCDSAANDLSHVFTDITPFDSLKQVANCANIWRIWTINRNNPKFLEDGVKCNSGNPDLVGVCYKRIGAQDYTFNSDYSWHPWEESIPAGTSASKPCNTFTDSNLTMLDANDSSASNAKPLFAKEVNIYSSSVCANPRFMIEPINLDFRGTYSAAYKESDGVQEYTFESDVFIQRNNNINTAQMLMYKMNTESNTIYGSGRERVPAVNSVRLYRITAKGYGRNGDTRAILQEIIMIDGFDDDSHHPRVLLNDHPQNLAYRIVRLSIRWIKP